MSRKCQNVPAEREEHGFTVCGETPGFCVETGPARLAPSKNDGSRWRGISILIIPINQLVLIPLPPRSPRIIELAGIFGLGL